ncbi:MAG TPA: NAD(P)H-hydrate dehydratase [Actinomycetota bacterium]|jgi:NAD(P)H-hydrate epimerase|nr:NAD(P)H-hydrate dehydratase [Actinomycetota bacterium]
MRPIVSAEEMRAADAAAIGAGTPAGSLMERAGTAVARAALRLAGKRYGAKVVIVCGPGNNGGDGYVAARVLRDQGASVLCLTVADPEDLKGPARSAYERFARTGVVRQFERRVLDGAGVIVDAIFGTGFRGEPRGPARDAITGIAGARGAPLGSEPWSTKVLSVDVPSGLGGPGPAVHADVTVALGAEKLETAVVGPEAAGGVEVANIGIAIDAAAAWMPNHADLAGIARRDPGAHKWTRSVAIVAGSDAMTGAAALAARSAFRAGAGYVTVVTTPGAEGIVRRLVPEAVVRVPAQDPVLSAGIFGSLGDALERAGAVAVGPGIGTGDEQQEMVRRLLREVAAPVVLDADGLNVMKDDPATLREREAPLALTPHAGELGRLLGRSSDEIQSDRIAAVMEASERFDCTVLLKGPRTLTYRAGRGLIVNPTGGAELATAGTGDVLTGVMAALAAGGDDAFTPAWQAAYLHGLAAGIASNSRGAVGLVAWDVAEALPESIAQLAPS